MLLLDGKKVAAERSERLRERLRLRAQEGRKPPGLAVILVGDDPASQVYVSHKVKACAAVGIASFRFDLPKDISQNQLETKIRELNSRSDVNGVLLQLPLPRHLDSERALMVLDARKDPDGLTLENQGLLFAGKARVAPCTPLGVMKILEHYSIPVLGKKAVVVGRSHIVGRPMAQLLLAANATVTICHSKTTAIEAEMERGDIVVVAAGQPLHFGKSAFKKNSVVIDVGIHRIDEGEKKGKLCGDVRSAELQDWVAAITPVPGGVGPMTIQMLLENTLTLTELSN